MPKFGIQTTRTLQKKSSISAESSRRDTSKSEVFSVLGALACTHDLLKVRPKCHYGVFFAQNFSLAKAITLSNLCCPRLARRAALVWLSLLQRRSDQTGLCLKVRPAWPARSVIWDCLWRVQWAQTTVTPFCHSGRLAYSAVRLGVGEPYHPMGEASTGRP